MYRVTSTSFYTPDRFSIGLIRDQGSQRFSDSLAMPVDAIFNIAVNLGAEDDFSQLSVGRGDDLAYDHAASTVRICGRDLSSGLQDTPTNDTFSNRTSSEIATILAFRHGLVPAVVPTSTFAGQFYRDDTSKTAHNQFSRTSTEWDLIVFLARCESFDVFVVGNTLYFQPRSGGLDTTIVLRPNDLMSLKARRRLRFGGDIVVTVKSWDSKKNLAVSETVVSRRLPVVGNIGTVEQNISQRYCLVQPNVSSDHAVKMARNRVEELARHEQRVEITMPGEKSLTPRSSFSLQGTQSDFDQIYQVNSVERVISPASGFLQRVSAYSISNSPDRLLAEQGDRCWII